MYELQALIAGAGAMAELVTELGGRPVALGGGLVLLPCVATSSPPGGGAGGGLVPPFEYLADGAAAVARAASSAGPVAYVEAFFTDGQGGQDAVVWDGGAVVLGPLSYRGWEPGTAINAALQRLGVVPDPGTDAFATVGLGRHRRTEHWLPGHR